MVLRERVLRSRLDGQRRAEARAVLLVAVQRLVRGEAEAARAPLEAAHERVRNAPLLHLSVHLGEFAASLGEGRPGVALSELPQVLLAVPGSLVRRLAGVPPDAPAEGSILGTWRSRRRWDAMQ